MVWKHMTMIYACLNQPDGCILNNGGAIVLPKSNDTLTSASPKETPPRQAAKEESEDQSLTSTNVEGIGQKLGEGGPFDIDVAVNCNGNHILQFKDMVTN